MSDKHTSGSDEGVEVLTSSPEDVSTGRLVGVAVNRNEILQASPLMHQPTYISKRIRHYDLCDEKELFEAARKIFGVHHRMDKCIEECAELIVALRHYPDKKADNGDVMEEIADVFIAISQMVMLFEQGPDDFDTAVNKQLAKLRGSVEAYRGF